MSNYIDKSNLYKSIADREEEYRSALLKEKNYNTATALQLQGLLNASTLIKHLVFDYPTVNAVKVVRCKECMWFYDVRDDGWGRCGEHDDYGRDSGWWQSADYCSWGEMREDD